MIINQMIFDNPQLTRSEVDSLYRCDFNVNMWTLIPFILSPNHNGSWNQPHWCQSINFQVVQGGLPNVWLFSKSLLQWSQTWLVTNTVEKMKSNILLYFIFWGPGSQVLDCLGLDKPDRLIIRLLFTSSFVRFTQMNNT